MHRQLVALKKMTDQGFATVLVTSVVAVFAVVAMTLLGVGLLLSARMQVQRAADLVALAAAPITEDPPCEVARDVARLNSVNLRECEWRDGQATVVVDRVTGLLLVPELTASSSAKVVTTPTPPE